VEAEQGGCSSSGRCWAAGATAAAVEGKWAGPAAAREWAGVAAPKGAGAAGASGGAWRRGEIAELPHEL
jgi:hypothetical protein